MSLSFSRKNSSIFFVYLIVLELFMVFAITYQVSASENEEQSNLANTIIVDNNTYEDSKITSNNDVDIVIDIIIPFILQLFGAGFGVLFAIWFATIDNRKKAKTIKKEIEKELNRIIQDLKERTADESGIDYYKYKTPMWDICLKSGVFNQLDSDTYKKYMDIYAYIHYAKEIEEDWWLLIALNGDEDLVGILQEHRMNAAKDILNRIEKTINLRNIDGRE